jgi:hypothetical protein
MASVQSESERWNLADALAKKIPSGSSDPISGIGFGDIVEEATKKGVAGKFSVTTLRLYRDTANRWPSDKRVANVSFTAHRTSEALGDVDAQVKLLENLVKSQGGADKVTVSAVRQAVRVAQKKTVAPPTAAAKSFKVLTDLMNGAPELIGAINGITDSADLDKIQAGLTKALVRVEQLRSKAAQKAQKQASSTPPTPITSAKKAVAPAVGGMKGQIKGV